MATTSLTSASANASPVTAIDAFSAPLSRRGMLGRGAALAAGATIASAAAGAVIGDGATRGAWIAAVARLDAAQAAEDRYDRMTATPADVAYTQGRREMPAFEMPGSDGEEATTWNATTLRQFASPPYDTSPTKLAMFARAQLGAIDAVDAHNAALLQRLNFHAIGDEFDRLVDVTCGFRDQVFATPAPDWQAVACKLRLLQGCAHLAGGPVDDDPLPMIVADAERLARVGLT